MAHATMISIPLTPYLTLNSVPTLGTAVGSVGSDGFEFFDFGQGGTSASNTLSTVPYASIGISASATYTTANNGYSQLTVNGTKKYTGVEIGGAGIHPFTFVTITLSSTSSLVPYEFQIGLLDDNTANGSGLGTNDTAYTISDVTEGTSVTTTDADAVNGQNDFYFVDFTGAQANDTIVISGTAAVTAELGGITFDTIQQSAPEPASAGVLAFSTAGLLLRRRRRDLTDRRKR
jgi:hypothetical protein